MAITLTASAAAAEFSTQVSVIQHGLRRLGMDVARGNEYALKDLVAAIYGDYKTEKARETKLRADMLQLELQERDGNLIGMAQAKALVISQFRPARDRLLALSAAMCFRVNPADPAHAREVLDDWVRDTLTQLSSELNDPKEETTGRRKARAEVPKEAGAKPAKGSRAAKDTKPRRAVAGSRAKRRPGSRAGANRRRTTAAAGSGDGS